MKYQLNCWRTHYLMFLKTLIVTVKMTVTLLLLEIGKNKIVHPLPSTTGVFGEYFLKISVHKNSYRICYKFIKKQYKS